MFYYNKDLNFSQVRYLLNELDKLNKPDQAQAQVYLSSSCVSVTPAITSRVQSWMSSWMGWNTDLQNLEGLTGKVLTFIQNHPNDASQLEESEFEKAQEGLFNLLNKEELKENKNDWNFVNNALFNIASASQILKKIKKEKEAHPSSSSASSNAPTSSSWNYFPSFLTSFWKSSQSSPAQPNKEAFIEAAKMLSPLIHFQITENSDRLRQEITKLLLSQKDNAKVPALTKDDRVSFLRIPRQFNKDAHRARKISITTFVNENEKKTDVIQDLQLQPHSSEEIAQKIIGVVGDNVFNHLATLMHQNFPVYKMEELCASWPVELLNNNMIPLSGPMYFNLIVKDATVTLDALIIFEVKDTGFFGFRQNLTFLKQELERDSLTPEQAQELVVQTEETIYALFPTHEEALADCGL